MKRTLYSLMLLLGLVLSPVMGAAAQPVATDTVFTSEVAGVDVDLGSSGDVEFIPEDYDLRESGSFSEEFIWFTTNASNFQLAFVAGPTTADEYHQITFDNMIEFYDDFVVLDEGTEGGMSWFLGSAELDGHDLVVYFEYQEDVVDDIDMMVMQFTLDTEMIADLETVRNEVTVDGNPIFADTDTDLIADLLGVEAGDSTPVGGDDTDADGTATGTSRTSRTSGDNTDDSTPEADEDDSGTTRTSRTSQSDDDAVNTSETDGTEVDDDTDQPDRQTRTGRLGDEDSTPEVDDAGTTADLDGWEELGLVSDSEWESPTIGSVITWDTATWEFPTDYDEAIYVNGAEGYDVLTLQTTDGLGYVYITVENDTGNTPTDLTAYWASPEYADGFRNEITVIETSTTANTASVVYETTNTADQSLFVVVEATFMDDGTVVFSQISAAPETIHEVYGQYLDGVEVNGTTLDTTWTAEEIQELAGN